MNKADLIAQLSTVLGSRQNATVAVEAVVDAVIREVAAGGSVGITGFGTFERADRAPRTGRNPRTGERVPIASTSSPRFRPGTYFKDVVADPSQLPAEGLAGGRAPVGRASGDAGKGASDAGRTKAPKASQSAPSSKKSASRRGRRSAPATKTTKGRSSPATKTTSRRSSRAAKAANT